MITLAQRAFGGAGATLAWQAVRLALLLISIVALARLLAPTDFGLIAMVMSVVGLGDLIRDFGLSVASLQSKTLTQPEKSNLFWVNTAIGASLTAIVAVASWPIAALYDDHRLTAITQALSVTFIVGGISTQFKAQINRDLRFVTLGVVEAIPQALGLAAAVAIAVATHSYWSLVAQALTASLLEAALCVALARWRPGRYRRDVSIRRFVRFAGALVGTQGLAYISKNIDSVLLGVFRGASELGIYNRAYQIVVLPLTQVTAPLSRVAIPVLSRLQDDAHVYMKFLNTAQFATVTATSIFYGTLVGFGEPLVHLVLGGQWAGAVPIVQILAISGIFRSLGQVPYWIFVTLGRTRAQLVSYGVGQPLIVASIVLGVQWGGVGVATGCAVGYCIFWAGSMWWVGRVTGLPVFQLVASGIWIVVIFFLPVALIGALAVFVFGSNYVALVVGGLIAALSVAWALFGLRRYRNELVRFVRLARTRGR